MNDNVKAWECNACGALVVDRGKVCEPPRVVPRSCCPFCESWDWSTTHRVVTVKFTT